MSTLFMEKQANWLLRLVVGACLAFSAAAQAQQEIEEVIVTGSYIRGTPEDAASPVEVMTREEMDLSGNPSLVEMIKRMPAVTGVDGEQNQFQSKGFKTYRLLKQIYALSERQTITTDKGFCIFSTLTSGVESSRRSGSWQSVRACFGRRIDGWCTPAAA